MVKLNTKHARFLFMTSHMNIHSNRFRAYYLHQEIWTYIKEMNISTRPNNHKETDEICTMGISMSECIYSTIKYKSTDEHILLVISQRRILHQFFEHIYDIYLLFFANHSIFIPTGKRTARKEGNEKV